MRKAIARGGIRFLLALGIGATVISCGGTSPSDPVTIMVPWQPGTAEYKAFAAVVSKFENDDHHDIQVTLESTRAVVQQLDADLAAKDPPDLVDLPSPAAVKQYEGKGLRPLAINLSSYDQPWRGLAKSAGRVYAIPVKADVKSLIWYRIGMRPPASWQALESISRRGSPWCLGLASGSASGWPGADWIADILLSEHRAGTYRRWLAGRLSWTSSAIEDAWQRWGSLMRYGVAIDGGVSAALETPFNSAMKTGGCELEHGALSATGLISTKHGALSATGLKSTTHYTYVRFPDLSRTASPLLVSGDFMGLFTGNPNARKLLKFLSSDKAQALWVRQPGGYAMSADSAVSLKAYPLKIQRKIAGLLQPTAGTERCFGALDMMLPDMSAAFSQAVLDYVNDHNSLARLLGDLQQVQRDTGPSPVASRACS